MKVLNVIFSVLVLLLAVASAVGSFFLFEKRVDLVNGWGEFAKAVQSASAVMDSGSGTKVAADFSADKLAFKNNNADDVKQKLGKFVAQTRKVISQRNAMAESFVNIGARVGVRKEAADFTAMDKYAESTGAVVSGVNKVVNNFDRVINKVASVARDAGVSISREQIKRGNFADLDKLARVFESQKNAKDNYARALQTIGMRSSANAEFSDNTSSRASNAVVSAVNRQLDQVDSVSRELNRQKQVALAQEKVIAKLRNDVKIYKAKLGVDENTEVNFWVAGSDEARAQMKGSVKSVNNDYGYVVIDLGKKSTVAQNVGKKVFQIGLNLESGLELNVVRGKEYIATVTIDQVGENELTASIPAEKVDKIKAGDSVIWKKSVK